MSTQPVESMAVVGIDVGSSAVKVAVLRDSGTAGAELVLGRSERIRRRDPRALAEELFHQCLTEAGLEARQLGYVATTGDAEEV